jgi:hypothetical protein
MLKNELKEYLKLDLASLVINYKRKNPMIGIYMITYKNKIYIGQSNDIENRFCHSYKKVKCTLQRLLYYSLKKYGVENFTFEVIHRVEKGNLSKEELRAELNKLETHYVKVHNSFVGDNKKGGLNLTRAGDCGEPSQETKDKISKSLTGRKANLSDADRLKKSLAFSGENNPMYGKSGEQHNRYGVKQTSEHIAKTVAKNTGKKQSEEHKEKNRIASTGREFSRESIAKREATKKRKKEEQIANGTYEKPVVSSETRKKQSESHKGKKPSAKSIQKGKDTRKRNKEEQIKSGTYVKKVRSEESRMKNKEAQTGKKLSAESIKNREETKKINREEAIANGTYVKRVDSEETRIRKSESHKYKKQSEGHIRKRVESRIATLRERLTMIF